MYNVLVSYFAEREKGKQRSTKHTHQTKDGVTGTPLNTDGELR
jgi:hypothetical protein